MGKPAGRASSFLQSWRLSVTRLFNSPNPSESSIRVARFRSGSGLSEIDESIRRDQWCGGLLGEIPAYRTGRGKASGGSPAARSLRRVAVRAERFIGGSGLVVVIAMEDGLDACWEGPQALAPAEVELHEVAALPDTFG